MTNEALDRYGGWTGKKFEASGFFRVEKDERWWLVTPEENAFLTGDFAFTMITETMPRPYGPVADNLEERAEWTAEFFRSAFARPDFGEAPMAYKDIEKVIKAELDLIQPVVRLRPLGVIKG